MSTSHCRFYENKFPEVDDVVMVNVQQIAEMGAYVKLLEYDNIEGMILLSELSRRRIISIQKLISVGKNDSRLKDKLPTEDYDKLIETYRLDSAAATWQSLQTASQLFIETARIVADQLGFDFPDYPAHVIAYEEKVMGESSAVQPQK